MGVSGLLNEACQLPGSGSESLDLARENCVEDEGIA
jgi:hypothetical protein